jgi:3-oxoacyl-[acyl-carrier-protein] synthase-3
MKSVIANIEYYLPTHIEDGNDLSTDNPEWRISDIEDKTGIKKRHISATNETASDLAVFAAEKLFHNGVKRETIDCLIFVTQSPDYVLPATACIIHERLGLNNSCLAFDVNQGCSGFVVGLGLASSVIESNIAKNVLLLCGETYTKYINRNDRTCRPLFSDGAAATLVQASETDCIGPFEFGTDGSGACNLIVENSGSRKIDKNLENEASKIFMNGSEVFMFTMEMVPKSVLSLLQKSKKSIDDIDLFIFHQASKLVLSNIQRRLKIDNSRIFNNIENIGNTVSATIPIALKDAVDQNRIKDGDTVVLVGFGVGYSWAACLIKYHNFLFN